MSKSSSALGVAVGIGVAAALGIAYAVQASTPTITREQAIEQAAALFHKYGGEPLAQAAREWTAVALRQEAGEATQEEITHAAERLGAAMEQLSEADRVALINEAVRIAKSRKVKQ